MFKPSRRTYALAVTSVLLLATAVVASVVDPQPREWVLVAAIAAGATTIVADWLSGLYEFVPIAAGLFVAAVLREAGVEVAHPVVWVPVVSIAVAASLVVADVRSRVDPPLFELEKEINRPVSIEDDD